VSNASITACAAGDGQYLRTCPSLLHTAHPATISHWPPHCRRAAVASRHAVGLPRLDCAQSRHVTVT